MSGSVPVTRHSFGIGAVVLTLLAWSSIPLFLRHFAESIDAWTSNGWRYGFSAFLWAPPLIVGAVRGKLPPGLWRAALLPSAVNALGQVTFTWAHYKIDPGLLTFGLRSQIIFAAVGAFVLFAPERVIIGSRGFLIGLCAVVGGTAGAVLLGDESFAGARASGVVLSIASGAFFACYGLAVKYSMKGISSPIAFAAISQYTAAAMVLLMVCFGERAGLGALDLAGGQFALLLLSAVIGIALGHVLYYASIEHLGVAVSAGVIQLQPFFVAVASFFIFDEILNTAQWISGAIAVFGAVTMLAVQRAQHVRSVHAARPPSPGGGRPA